MRPRSSLNSSVLMANFPSVYREFFSKCQIAVSSPHFFTWAGEYVGYFGGVMVLQKLPLRIYVGLEFLSEAPDGQKAVIDSDAKSYSLKENKFKKDQYEHLAQERLLDFINQHLSRQPESQPFRIHLLSEMPFGGSGSAGALCAALSLALGLKDNKLGPEDILQWGQKETGELLASKKYKFGDVLRLSWKMLAAYRGKETSGGTLFVSLLPSKYPVFYNLKPTKDISLPLVIDPVRDRQDLSVGQGERGSNGVDGDYSLLDRVEFQAGRLDELFKIPKNSSWPIDFGLIYLGEPRGTTPFPTHQLQDDMEETVKFLKQNFKESNGFNKNLWQQGLGVMNFLSTQVLMKLGKILKTGAREDALREFLRALDKHQALFLLLGLLPKTVDSVTAIVHYKARKLDELGAGLKSVSTTKKDIILFAFPHSRVREVLSTTLQDLEKDLGIEINLGYASWLDGIEERGVLVEQFLEKEIYSDFVSKDTVFVREFTGKGKSATLLLTPEEFENKKQKVDILIEQPGDRVYARGELLSSKELHSSRATVQVLKAVLKSPGKEISNTKLQESSYSLDRYELQGKIVSPLLKAIEKRGGKKLPFTIKGGVTDFKLKLDFGSYTIWLK